MHSDNQVKPAGLAAGQRGLKIIFRPRAELKPDLANPRQHSKKQIRQIAKSIKEFDFNVPILVDAELNVIAGHGRLLACHELGIDKVPTVCLEHLTPAQARAFMIADNKLAENATWDDRLLAEQLRDLSLSGLDFDIEVTGFEMGEIDLRIESLEDPPAEDEADPADVVPEIVVVNDHSQDGSEGEITKFLSAHEGFPIALVSLQTKRGLAEARNTGFRLARAEFVLVLDAEHSVYPQALSKLKAVLERSGADARGPRAPCGGRGTARHG